jgi:uncharacterized protein (DUF1501 family)
MKRRSFLGTGAAIGLPLLVNGLPLGALASRKMQSLINQDNDRVLVLIQLVGGNDGLNTIFSLDQYVNLQEVRQNIIVPENELIQFDGSRAFHPSMTSMKQVWEDGYLGLVQGVAYPNQNRSHFRSTDIWHTASEADEYLTTGWLGRFFDQNHLGYPEGYPSAQYPDPFALTIGGGISETCQGQSGSYAMSIVDPLNPGQVNLGTSSDFPDNCYGNELEYVRSVALQANAYASTIQQAAESGTNVSTKYADDNPLAQKMKTVAQLISGGLKTKVYVVSIGTFDLHSAQVDPNNTSSGRHAELLAYVSDAICAFQEDMVQQGLEERVLGMTYSEFGRRIRSNNSDGTDHGTAAPMFLFGSCVEPQVTGDDAEIDRQVDNIEGVAMQYDFRSIYGTVLVDWFGVEENVVRDIIFEDFQYLPILRLCETTKIEELNPSVELSVYPNPFWNNIHLNIAIEKEDVLRVSLFDALGSEIKVVSNRSYNPGNHQINIETHELSTGSYFLRIAGKYSQKTKKIIKFR